MTYTLPVKVDEGTGTPLVLLHGLGNTYKSWGPVLEHLDYTKWRVVVPDLLGFGDAPKPAVEYTPKDHTDAVVAMLDTLGIDTAVIAGHSMGCVIAIDIARRYPGRAKQLVLFGAPLYERRSRANRWCRLTRAEGLYFSLFEVVKNNPDAVQAGGLIADELAPFVKGMKITEEIWPAYRKSLENTIMQYRSYRQVATLRTPTLFVNGLRDTFIIKRTIRDARATNRQYVQIRRTAGPHGLTPRYGRTVAQILNRLSNNT